MTDRGLPLVDGAPACPFVAFEDDRDERATSPDHRHRCYAEAKPAPRALAHQEAYCLSSAFPVCPTFQDWARREAARSRADAPRAADPDAGADQPRRNPPRNWAAPPPWLSRADRRAQGDPNWDDDEDIDEPRPDVPRQGRGLSGSYADRVAADPVPGMPGGPPDDELGTLTAAEASGIAAAAPPPPPIRRRERDSARMGEPHVGRDERAGGPDRRPGGPDRRTERRHEGPAPEWERAKPLEAYPTLRARRLPELSVPPILVAVVALALAAAVLFALPGLLGFGRPPAGATATPATAGATTLPSLGPTSVPQPTTLTYIVAPGDTMSMIAGRFGVPLEELIAANSGNVPNPDQLEIGQELIIPVPLATELPAASEIPAAS